ncbi:MAG: glycoside hydrolase family 3 C-terminal domain-containing protein [Clostridia bacterium]|nr:glycoside hydrolase family 3 C-terminal domain-containing protein [Clostridia bacterium]
MKRPRKVFKTTHSLVWLIVTIVLVVVFAVITIVTTQVSLIYGTLNLALGGPRPNTADGEEPLYELDEGLETKQDVYEAAQEFNKSIEEEGAVLLKNDGTLPLDKGAKISVFGKNSVNLVYSGSGSSAASGDDIVDLYGGLSDFDVNPTLKSFYESSSQSGSGRSDNPSMDGNSLTGFATGETPVDSYTSTVKESFKTYNEAAIVVISRIGGEGFDLPRTMVDSYGGSAVTGANADDHYLELDNNEKAMIEMVCENFSKVVVLLNTSSTMELGDLESNSNINAILWIGLPGQNGAAVIGDILDGTINPSGRTTDTYAADFTTIPSYQNFGDNQSSNGNRYITDNSKNTNKFAYVEYEEGIYVGYRYFETRGYTDGEDWYNANVVYPFGYGLSYTTFSWTVTESPDQQKLEKNSDVSVTVHIENDSEVAGKDVVELYVRTPYTEGGIEKADKVLVAYAKTDEIVKGDDGCDVTLTFNAYDLASYDYSDANKNSFKGYELEAGEYTFFVSTDAHTPVATFTMTVDSDIQYDKDPSTGKDVGNLFDEESDYITTYLSRTDWDGTFPTTPTEDDRTTTSSWLSQTSYSVNDSADDPWYTTEMPATETVEGEGVQFKELVGLDYDDDLWDTFMDQLSVTQMAYLVGEGAFGTIAIEDFGIPMTYNEDGPAGFANFMDISSQVVFDVCNYAAECVVGATWNVDIAHEMGIMLGNEGLIGNGTLPYSGWYGPAANIHRSPFGGRNWEYYSEDPVISGTMASSVISGCNEKGLYVYMKHFVLNDQETDRDTNGLLVWCNEQAMRELYMKPFETALKNNSKAGVMSAFVRIGLTWSGGCYNLLTGVLRNEWGVTCSVVTDYDLGSYMSTDQMIRAGGDLCLVQDASKVPSTSDSALTATQLSCIRRAAKNILYTIANSSAMNVEITGYGLPIWEIILIVVDCAIVAGCAVWGVFALRPLFKKKKEEEVNQ